MAEVVAHTFRGKWNSKFKASLVYRVSLQDSQSYTNQVLKTQSPSSQKDIECGPGETVQWSKALAALSENLGSISSTHMVTHSLLMPIPEAVVPSTGLCQYCMHMVPRHICRKISLWKKKREMHSVMGMVAHTTKASTRESEAGRPLSSRPA